MRGQGKARCTACGSAGHGRKVRPLSREGTGGGAAGPAISWGIGHVDIKDPHPIIMMDQWTMIYLLIYGEL